MFFLCLPVFVSSAYSEVSVRARSFQPGEMMVVEVREEKVKKSPKGSFGREPLFFFKASSDTYASVYGLDLDVSTGPKRLEIRWKQGGKKKTWHASILVEHKEFPVQRLDVDPGYVKLSPENEKRTDEEAARLNALFSKATPKIYFQGVFASPIPGAMSSRFGSRRVFNNVPKSPHTGADLRAKKGEPVAASQGGKVVLAENLFYPGDTVILDHGWGIYTLYAHLSEILVKTGQMVKAGEIVGKVGATGRVTGPHLHWAAKCGRARIDPFSLMILDFSGVNSVENR